MKLKNALRDLIPLYNTPRSEVKRVLFSSFFISINILISVLILIIPIFREFFTVYFSVFNTLFVAIGVTSSESFYVLIKNQFRILLAVFIGVVVSYISHSISLYDMWSSIFITFTFVFISSGLMIKATLLPYNLGKLMYIPYFNLVFFNDPVDRSPIPFLKFLLTGVTPLFAIFLTGVIFNLDFSSTYYIQSCRQILKTSRKYISIMERQLEIKTLEAIDYPLDKTYQRNIINSVANRLNAEKNLNQLNSNFDEILDNDLNYIQKVFEENGDQASTSEYKPEDNVNVSRPSFHIPVYLKPNKQKPIPSPLPDIISRLKLNERGSPTSSINTEFSTSTPIPPRKVKINIDEKEKEKANSGIGIGIGKEGDTSIERKLSATHNFFKIAMEKLNVELSRNLNHMERYLVEAKKEFWNGDLFGYFNELSFLLETNHKKLLTINTSLLENIGSDKSKTLLVILPSLNTLITTIVKIFRIMENQISKKYKPADHTPALVHDQNFNTSNLFESIDMQHILEVNELKKGKHFLKSTESIQKFKNLKRYKTLEYSQYKILMCFDIVDKTIKDINNVLVEIYIPEESFYVENIDEETRVNFMISAFKKFSKEQKVLASTVFMLSHTLWTKRSGRRQHLTMITSTFTKWYNNIKNFKKKRPKKHDIDDYPPDFPIVKYTLLERAKIIWNLVLERLLVKWRYSLSFSLSLTILAIVYYELKIHTNFILFKNLAWAVITYCLVSTPSVGALAFFSILRVIGAIAGSILGYACAVVYSQTTDPARAFIFAVWAFCIAFVGCVFTRAKSFEKLIVFFMLSFVIIAFLAYPLNTPSIITSLLRMMHILFAVVLVLIISITFCPYYEHKQLTSNLYQFPYKISQTFNFLICNTLIDPNILPIESRQLYYKSNKFNYIQNNLKTIEMTQKSFKELLAKQLNLLRYPIPILRNFLMLSKYEILPFKKKKYYQLRRLLYSETKLFHSLLSLEFITVSALPKKHLIQVAKIISNNFIRLMAEIDYLTIYMRNIESSTEYSDNNPKLVQENQSKQICNEITKDISEYIYNNRYDIESLNLLRYCSAIIFCLISFIDLFNLVFEKVAILSNTTIMKRVPPLTTTQEIEPELEIPILNKIIEEEPVVVQEVKNIKDEDLNIVQDNKLNEDEQDFEEFENIKESLDELYISPSNVGSSSQ